MRLALFLSPWLLGGTASTLGLASASACSHGVYDGSYDGGPSTTTSFASAVTVGPEGAEVGSSDGAFTMIIPRAALSGPISIAIAPAGIGGARTTALYRVSVTPKAVLLHPASVTFDVQKAQNGPSPVGDPTPLRLGSGVDPTSTPTTNALEVTGRPSKTSLVFTGLTYEIERVFGLVDNDPRGKVATAPNCISACCADGGVTEATVENGCGCAVLGAPELACLQQRCDRSAIASGCSVAR